MDNVYIVIGLAIIFISIVFIIYGIITNNDQVIGISLSFMVLGIVFSVIGYTYVKPLEELLKCYSLDLGIFTTKTLEDMGIIDSSRVRTCLANQAIVFSEKSIECSKISIGVGVYNNIYYVAIPMENTIKMLTESIKREETLVSAIKKLVIDISSICRSISVIEEEENYIVVELTDILNQAKEFNRYPVNIIRLSILLAISIYLDLDTEIVEEVSTPSSYRAKIKIIGR